MPQIHRDLGESMRCMVTIVTIRQDHIGTICLLDKRQKEKQKKTKIDSNMHIL